MEHHFGNIKVTANDAAGAAFLKGMITSEHKSAIAREQFRKFLLKWGIKSWHTHNGWVRDSNNKSGSHVIDEKQIFVTWIYEQEQCHSDYIPDFMERFAVVKPSPYGDENEILTIYVYDFVNKVVDYHYPTVEGKFAGKGRAIYKNGEYQLYKSKRKHVWWKSLIYSLTTTKLIHNG